MSQINPQAVRGPVTAVPVVAGTGVRFVEDVQNNRVVAEVDETVLLSTPVNIQSGTEITLSEVATNFETIRVDYGGNNDTWVQSSYFPGAATRWGVTKWAIDGSTYFIVDGAELDVVSETPTKWKANRCTRCQFNSNNSVIVIMATTGTYVRKVVGINRVASA